MKHIKTYNNLFESSDEPDWTIIDTVKDLLLDLHDDGISVNCNFIGNGPNKFEVTIGEIDGVDWGDGRDWRDLFVVSNYKTQLELVKNFLESEGYKFHSFTWFPGYYPVKHSYMDFSSRRNKLFNNELMNLTTTWVRLYFR